MSWSGTDKNKIIVDYWSTGRPICPSDQTPLRVSCQAALGQGNNFSAWCPRCRGLVDWTKEDDPQKNLFRVWNESEIKMLSARYFRYGAAQCPVCAAEVSFQESRTIGAPVVLILNCHRCENWNSDTQT